MTMAQSIGGSNWREEADAVEGIFHRIQTKTNSPLELFEQFEQSDDLRLWTKGRIARGGTNRMWWTSKPGAKLSAEYMADDKNEVTLFETTKKEDTTGKEGSTIWLYGFSWKKVDEGGILQVNKEEKVWVRTAQGEKFSSVRSWQKGDDSRTHPPHQGDFSFVLA